MSDSKFKGRFKWTKEREQELIALYKENLAIKAIADHFGTSVNSISSKVKRLKTKGDL